VARGAGGSFAIRGERGVIDILAFHRERALLLVIELKTEIVDVNELLGTIDRRQRLAVQVALERGWPVGRATRVSAWVIVASSRTNHRRFDAHRAVLRAGFPTDGRTMPGWLVRPMQPIRALSFWPDSHPGNARIGLASVRRVRPRSPRTRSSGRGAPQRPATPLQGPSVRGWLDGQVGWIPGRRNALVTPTKRRSGRLGHG
jgi:hypothetical protein